MKRKEERVGAILKTTVPMALRESSVRLPNVFRRTIGSSFGLQPLSQLRNASTQSSSPDNPVNELESESSLSAPSLPEDQIKSYDPIARSRARRVSLPRSR